MRFAGLPCAQAHRACMRMDAMVGPRGRLTAPFAYTALTQEVRES